MAMVKSVHTTLGTPSKRTIQENTCVINTSIKRIKTDLVGVPYSDKNPISVLNGLRQGLKYDVVEQLGPMHAPIFRVAVEVDGHVYYGSGGSKKIAKCRAAEEALKSFIQFPTNNSYVFCSASCIDFTDDSIESLCDKKQEKLIEKNVSKGPVMLINELYPNATYDYIATLNTANARFKVIVNIGSEKFYGTGPSKKLAKTAAATSALSCLTLSTPNLPIDVATFRKVNVLAEDQERADYIGRLIQETFAKLMKNDAVHARKKVLASIVMTRGTNLEDSVIISITTGTKCISGEYISMKGATLNDMHAEIICRRRLLLYLYDQLELLLNNETAENSIFEIRSDGVGYKLKKDVEFHLYINTAPCGDARIFSPHEESGDIDRHPNRVSRGQLRTKIESGEGTIPVKSQPTIQTWDGVIQGERLLTMSCSDKICKWNVVGLQGALLSNFIEPIYLKSIILGSLLKESHSYRAICGRVENTLQGLPPPFHLNRPTLCLLTSREIRQPCRAPNFAVIWGYGQDQPEIINTTTGKPEFGISIVCKQELIKRFLRICGKLSSITGIETKMPLLYCEAKNSVISYRVAKENVYAAFVKAGLGSWLSKPLEQDTFEMTCSLTYDGIMMMEVEHRKCHFKLRKHSIPDTEKIDSIDANMFEKVCEETLESLTEYFEQIMEEANNLQSADVSYNSGVLTVSLGNDYGTYVINRQSPNKQIWLSSPISGPKRYDFVVKGNYWIYKHDGKTLHQLLQKELSKILNNVDFSNCSYAKL